MSVLEGQNQSKTYSTCVEGDLCPVQNKTEAHLVTFEGSLCSVYLAFSLYLPQLVELIWSLKSPKYFFCKCSSRNSTCHPLQHLCWWVTHISVWAELTADISKMWQHDFVFVNSRENFKSRFRNTDTKQRGDVSTPESWSKGATLSPAPPCVFTLYIPQVNMRSLDIIYPLTTESEAPS